MTPENRSAALGRRAPYQFPPNFKETAEYWFAGQPEVVVVFGADTFDPIFKLQLDWQDVFKISVHLMVTAEAGLQIGAGLLGAGWPRFTLT